MTSLHRTNAQVWEYIKANNVPYNELFDKGYKSIGDFHSTKPTLAGASERSGRTFGDEKEKTECGIHARYVRRVMWRLKCDARTNPQEP
jgi:phosphoadenosine phosphosulfate reductase